MSKGQRSRLINPINRSIKAVKQRVQATMAQNRTDKLLAQVLSNLMTDEQTVISLSLGRPTLVGKA